MGALTQHPCQKHQVHEFNIVSFDVKILNSVAILHEFTVPGK